VQHLLLLAALQGALLAPSIEGTWQGMLTVPNQSQIRLAFKIAKNGNAYEGRFYRGPHWCIPAFLHLCISPTNPKFLLAST